MTISYTFTPLASLAYPNAGYTEGVAINDSGQVVGKYGDPFVEYSSSAFLYSGGTYTNIDPVGYYSEAFDISNDGKVLLDTDSGSYYYDPMFGPFTPRYDYYIYDNGTYTLLTNTPVGYLPGDVVTFGTAISDAGVVGYSYDPLWSADGQAQYQGFLFENGVYTAINVPGAQYTVALDINDLGQVVGYASYNGGDIIQGFLYDNGVFTTLADPNWIPQWINNDGEIVGHRGEQYIIDDNGVFTDINVPGASQTIVQGISDAGVFGSYTVAYTGYSGFIYKDGVYTTVDDSWSVTAMSASGQQLIENGTEIATLQVVADPTVVADHDHVNLYQTVVENAANGVLANDTDPISTDALSVSAVNGSVANVGMPVQGLYGALTLAADGSYSYTATHALPDDGVGFDTFSYTAETGTGGQATTDLTIVVVGSDKHYFGGTPDTTINGGAYNFDGQVLDGSQGNDILIAGSSATVEIGGPGDTLTGSTMADKFVFHGDDFGHNEITNFNVKMDTIWFDSTEFTSYQQVLAHATQVGNGKNATTIINDGTGDVIQLDHVQLSALHASDFYFV
jgi:probable HAF family extracellular repeat protein/VCBS repeat-containing protein